jgi:hypothetical protein
LNMNQSSFSQASGNHLTCVATAANDAGSSSGAASVFVAPVVVPLPVLGRLTVLGETTQTSTLTEAIGVPSIPGFDSAKMSLVLSLSPATGSCSSNTQVTFAPTTIYCSGLAPSTSYSAQLTVSYLTGGNGATQVSPTLSFTTARIQSSLYVCSTSCSGTLTDVQMSALTSDKRAIEAKGLRTVIVNGSETGAPITNSTCAGTGCNAGTAPALPVSCGNRGIETTELVANVSGQITTAFRYCRPNATDTTAPTISNNSLVNTGYAPIIPITAAPGTSIQVRFGAADAAGVASASVRLVNPGNVVVATSSAAFLVGSVTSGTYQAYIATATSGPLNGDVYQIQAQASDAAGNSSAWLTIGTFTIQVGALKPIFGGVTSTSTGFTFQIGNYDSAYTWVGSATPAGSVTINSSGLVTVASLPSGTSSTVTITTTRTGYGTASTAVTGTAANAPLPTLSAPVVSSVTSSFVVVTQPAKPTGWDSNWQLIAQVYSNDQSTLIGAASPGSYYTPGSGLSVTANNAGGITPDTNYQVRFAVYDSSLSRYSYGPFTQFRTIAVAASISGLGTIPAPTTIGIIYPTQIVLNAPLLGNISGYSSTLTWSVRTVSPSGSVVSNLPANTGNQIYITGLNPSTSYSVYITATDAAGGTKSSAALITNTQALADTQAPAIDLANVTVSPTSLYENGTISIVAPISDNTGVSIVTVTIGQLSFNLSRTSGTATSGTWSGSSGMNFRGGQSDGFLQPGVYSPLITATDSAGNSSSVSKSAAFILGQQAGGATIASANAVSASGVLYPGGNVQISANIIAYNQIISAVRFSSDGNNLSRSGVLTEVSGNSYNKNFVASFAIAANQTPGNFTINLVAETANGRSSTTFPVTVSVSAAPVDAQAPSVLAGSASLTSPSITGQVVSVPSIGNISDGMSTNSDYTVAINVTDNVGVSSVTFYVDTSGDASRLGTQIPSTIGYATLVSGTAQSGIWSATSRFPSITGLAPFSTACGRYTVRVLAYDAAGNASGPIAARPIDIVSCSR